MFESVGLPHGFCFLWNPELLWLNVLSDSLIALAYFLIPFALIWIVRKRKDIPFNAIFFCFAAFIIACGITHVMEVVGMEGDIITTQDLFTFQFQGEGTDGKLKGAFLPSGIRPAFLPRAEYFGLDRALLEVI